MRLQHSMLTVHSINFSLEPDCLGVLLSQLVVTLSSLIDDHPKIIAEALNYLIIEHRYHINYINYMYYIYSSLVININLTYNRNKVAVFLMPCAISFVFGYTTSVIWILYDWLIIPSAFQFQFMTIATNNIQGCDLSNKMRVANCSQRSLLN